MVIPVTAVWLFVELQAAIHHTLATTSKSPNLRILLISLTDVAGFYPLRYQLRNVSLAMKASRMPGLLDHQARRVDGNRSTAVALPRLRRGGRSLRSGPQLIPSRAASHYAASWVTSDRAQRTG